MYKCKYCSRSFTRSTTLKRHQETTRACLRKQEEISTTITTTNPDLSAKIKELEEARLKDLAELKALISSLTASKSPVVQNMEPVTVAHIEAMALEHMDISDIEQGIDGIVEFTVKYPLQGRIVCTDKSRRKFRYTDENGDIINDYGGTKLSQTVFEGIQKRCVQLIDQKYAMLANDIRLAVNDNKGYEDYVLENMKQSTKLQTLKNDLINAAKGTENELQKDYIRKLVKKADYF